MNLSSASTVLWLAWACSRSSAQHLWLQGDLSRRGTLAEICSCLPPSAVGLSATASSIAGEETVPLCEGQLVVFGAL